MLIVLACGNSSIIIVFSLYLNKAINPIIQILLTSAAFILYVNNLNGIFCLNEGLSFFHYEGCQLYNEIKKGIRILILTYLSIHL